MTRDLFKFLYKQLKFGDINDTDLLPLIGKSFVIDVGQWPMYNIDIELHSLYR